MYGLQKKQRFTVGRSANGSTQSIGLLMQASSVLAALQVFKPQIPDPLMTGENLVPHSLSGRLLRGSLKRNRKNSGAKVLFSHSL
jgi:hypothetical protein